MSLSIRSTFEKIKNEKKGAFIPYFIMGYPDLETSYKLIRQASYFVDIIELGIPFSDPIADGPTIQKAVTHVLEQNISMNEIFETTKKLTSESDTPFVYMIYFNQIFAYGIEKFVLKMKEIGVKGIIVPDLLPDSEPEFNQIASDNGIELIYLITPITSPQRVSVILNACHGFLYFVAVVGITGERDKINYTIKPLVEELKTKTDLPICVGFGISSPEQVRNVIQFADGAIVGSAIVKKITDNIHSPDLVDNVTRMLREMSSVLSDGER